MASKNAAFKTGHKKFSPLEINIPAPSGGNFIPSSQRGPRPELPHRDNEGAGGDYAPIQLNDQQLAENKHIKVQQENWDAHHALEKEANAKPAKTAAPAGYNEEEMDPEARARYEADAAQPEGKQSSMIPLKEIHSSLMNHLQAIQPHVEQQHAVVKEVRRTAVERLNKSIELDLKHKSEKAKGQVPNVDEVELKQQLKADASNFGTFGQRHLSAMNKHATASALLSKANTLMGAGRTADATDLMREAHKHILSMSKHLNSPITKAAYEAAGKYIPAPSHESVTYAGNALMQNVNAEGGGVGRKRGPQGDAPVIKIGKPGRLKGDKGSLENITADEAGLKAVQDKYGTQHPYYKKVKQAHVAWKQGKQSNKSVRQIALGPVKSDDERTNDQVLEALRAGQAFKTPEQKKAEFLGHAKRVEHALVNGLPIPGESADHIGPENLKKLIARHAPKEN